MEKPAISVKLYRGRYLEPYEVCIPMSEDMIQDLCEPLELSDDTFAVLIHSLPMKRDYVEYRKRAIRLREGTAKNIAQHIAVALLKAFGANDKMNGYRRHE